jgi:hypothetical protein
LTRDGNGPRVKISRNSKVVIEEVIDASGKAGKRAKHCVRQQGAVHQATAG